jgi:hypothetical protein
MVPVPKHCDHDYQIRGRPILASLHPVRDLPRPPSFFSLHHHGKDLHVMEREEGPSARCALLVRFVPRHIYCPVPGIIIAID